MIKKGHSKSDIENLTCCEKLLYRACMEDEVEQENEKVKLIMSCLGVKVDDD